jgi:hypothetical protein
MCIDSLASLTRHDKRYIILPIPDPEIGSRFFFLRGWTVNGVGFTVTIVLSQLSDALDLIGADCLEQGMARWNTNVGQRSKGDRVLCARQLDGAADSTCITRVQHGLNLQIPPRSAFYFTIAYGLNDICSVHEQFSCRAVFSCNSPRSCIARSKSIGPQSSDFIPPYSHHLFRFLLRADLAALRFLFRFALAFPLAPVP